MGNGFGQVLAWLGITTAVGVIPARIITLLSYTRLLRRYAGGNLQVRLRESEDTPVDSATKITFTAENEKDTLTVALDGFLFIESAYNYSEFGFLQNEKLKKTLLCGSLIHFEEQAHHADIVRCHRSYIVNLQQVERISGNAQGYRLQFRNYDTPVSIARRYGDMVADYFRK